MDKTTSCMQANKTCHLQVATGGKENDFKIWDGNKPEKSVFQAKNVKYTKTLVMHKKLFFKIGEK